MSNALCVVSHVDTVDTRDQSKPCFNGSNTMLCYVDTVNTNMNTHFCLIFNGFSIQKKFWKAENQGFWTIPNMHTCWYCQYRHKISNAFNAIYVDSWYKHVHTFLSITFLIFNGFSIRKKFWKAENQGFPTTLNMYHVDPVDTDIRFLMHSMLWMSTLLIQTKRKIIH